MRFFNSAHQNCPNSVKNIYAINLVFTIVKHAAFYSINVGRSMLSKFIYFSHDNFKKLVLFYYIRFYSFQQQILWQSICNEVGRGWQQNDDMLTNE